MDVSDQELLTQYRAGDTQALECLVTRYQRQLYGFILNMASQEDADEVFQEVWFRALKKQQSYRHGNFLGWLMRIAHNLVIDRARRRKGKVSYEALTEEGVQVESDEPRAADALDMTELEASELGQKIESAVATLPQEQREVFVLRMQADLSFKEIAKIQKVSINTALGRMHYAVQKLRPLLREDYALLGRGQG